MAILSSTLASGLASSAVVKAVFEILFVPAILVIPLSIYLFTDYIENALTVIPGVLRWHHMAQHETAEEAAAAATSRGEHQEFASWWTLPTCVVLFIAYSSYLRSGRAEYLAKHCAGSGEEPKTK
mmetsp:Transcript_19859/g.50054  ORF Transcript_19859/g.50054 Transcript_19859/m.50054 type:complete len:125 (+) Transcript_19859:3389-3763(+)